MKKDVWYGGHMTSLSDLDCANLCQDLYNGKSDSFDKICHTAGVDYAIKLYDDCAAVVFEGSHNIPDWLSNMETRMIHPENLKCGVEDGFYDGMEETLGASTPYLPKDLLIYVTGHSRGGAHAEIFAAQLILLGYAVKIVVFGCPLVGDEDFCKIISGVDIHSYRNYRNVLEQDFVCTVPEHIPLIAEFQRPHGQIIIDVAPLPDDPWLLLSRHHLFLYIEGLKKLGN